MIHLPLVDGAARFDHLEPAQVLDGFVGAFNGLVNGVLDRSGRGAGEFDEFIDVVFHVLRVWATLPPRNVRLFAAAAAGVRGFLDHFFDRFTGFAGALLDPANQFFLFAFSVLKIVIRELGPLLLQLAFGDVPVAFDFECRHNNC